MSLQLKHYYVIYYDIEKDRARSKVSRILEDYGIRMQKSVFEAYLKKEQLEELVEKCQVIGNMDLLRVYSLTKQAYKSVRVIGRQEFWVDEADIIV